MLCVRPYCVIWLLYDYIFGATSLQSLSWRRGEGPGSACRWNQRGPGWWKMHGLLRGPGPAVCSPGGGVPPDPPFNPGPDPIQGCQVLQGGRDTHGLCPLTHVSHDPRGLLMAGLLKRGLRFPLWRVSCCRIMTPGQHLAAGTSMMHCLSGSSTTVRYCTQYCSEILYSVLQWDTVFSTAVRYCIQYCSELLYPILQWDTVFSTAVRYCIQYS